MTTKPQEYDLQAEFDAEIEPMIRKLHERCIALGMPIRVDVCWASNDEGNRMGYKALSAGALPEGRTPITFYLASDLVRNEIPNEDMAQIAALINKSKECDCPNCSAQKTDGTLVC